MNRLFVGMPQRSNGRLNVSQLAIEADVKRWHLTHQHPDIKELFQAKAAEQEAERAAHVQSTDTYEVLERGSSSRPHTGRFFLAGLALRRYAL
ncbi:hypothetical protein [Streptomyces cyaneofuscatus]|uniref:hypothetical protein n=1 Tax=Streptomyces cyaneofuscatus TaxID=66883 RepID=UPI00378E4F27